MINMLQAEHLKYKGTFARILAFIAPAYVLLDGFVQDAYIFCNSTNWWEVMFLPFVICIMCALSVIREKKAGNYRTLKSKNINLKKMWFSKIITVGYYTFISSLVIIINILIVKLIFRTNFTDLIDIKKVIIAILTIWFTTLILIPINLFLAEKFGTFVAIAVTCIGIVVGALVVREPSWYLWPWSISTRLMCPILNLNPNGCLIEAGDPLLNSSVIPIGIIASIIGFITFSLLTSLWFAKKEVR